MDLGLDLNPVAVERRRSSLVDVLFLYAGANIVTTTLVTGASLAPAFSFSAALALIFGGVLIGSGLIALLARLGPRYGLPSMVVLRHPFGTAGAAAISLILILTNFAWIAFNNVIAADALAGSVGGSSWVWNAFVGAVAIGVALFGPRAMALFDRLAVPIMLAVGAAVTLALFGLEGRAALHRPGDGSLGILQGFDIVVGYQISWSLMFADYTRYQRREDRAALGVFLGLGLSSLWLMAVGVGAGLAGGGNDPTSMILGLDLPLATLLLMALSTITTNFVNLYLSSLALRNLWRGLPGWIAVLGVGAIGTALGLVSPDLLERYGSFMEVLGALLLPIVAVAAVHFFVPLGAIVDPSRAPSWRPAAVAAWAVGALSYQLLRGSELGATFPSLAVAAASYLLLRLAVPGRER